MARTDSLGLAVSTPSSDALAAYEHGVERSLRWRSGALDALNSAVAHDPLFISAHCSRAYIAWRMGKYDVASEAHQQAMALADHAYDEREQQHIRIVDAMSRSAGTEVMAHLEQLADLCPSDRMGLRLLSINYLARGDYQQGVPRARRSLEAHLDNAQFQTMLAFFLEQSDEDPDEGLQLGLRSLQADPGNLYTYHAVGHNYAARGDYAEALATFERANSLERYPHLLWHLAEAHAILGDERITQDYWSSTAQPLPLFERIELCWRRELLRHAVVPMSTWKELATQGEQLLEHANFLTIWMHHWIGLALARAGETEKAEQQLARLRHLPEGRASGYWSTLGADLLEGEMALIRGDIATAVQWMTPTVQRIHDMGGGSREQKDIFQDVCLDLHRRLGHVDTVLELAQRRLQRNPNHFHSLAALAWAHGQAGHTSKQQQTYREILSRAETGPVYGNTPAVAEACQALQAET